MRKRRIGYAIWLLLAACLYFFENNTGTRAVLFCSLLLPLIPPFRAAFFIADDPENEKAAEQLTVKSFTQGEAEDTGEIRPYVPGDPVRRIHWKLSAKKDELLIRKTAAETAETAEERTISSNPGKRKGQGRRRTALIFAAGAGICVLLLLLIPEANRGAQALCNRIFDASEAVNAYAYVHFPVPESQNVLWAAALLACIPVLLCGAAVLLRSRLIVFGIIAACILFQVYFGLAFPAWIQIPLCASAAIWMMRRPGSRKTRILFCAAVLLAALLTALAWPGTDSATEAASETVRDQLNRAMLQMTGTLQETPEGETETRHVHSRRLENGGREAETEQEFRLVTAEEEQISMPHWVNWVKVFALLLLAVALITLPFAPFLLLNARWKKAEKEREAFSSGGRGEAVQAVFRRVIRWLEAAGAGGGNLLYREWGERLPECLPEGYRERFARCAADFEEAAYSDHEIPEEKRQNALALLKETEDALWENAGRRQRLKLKYWMCLHE